MRPVRYARITNPFGAPGNYASRSDSHGRAGHHTGIDFGDQILPFPRQIDGLPVRSSTSGVVVISAYDPEFMGNWVGVYYAADDVTITYWHMADRKVIVGQQVAQGDVLGHVGNTGNSTATHLHVQANHGRGFSYHAHIPPGPWCRGLDGVWPRIIRERLARRRAARRR